MVYIWFSLFKIQLRANIGKFCYSRGVCVNIVDIYLLRTRIAHGLGSLGGSVSCRQSGMEFYFVVRPQGLHRRVIPKSNYIVSLVMRRTFSVADVILYRSSILRPANHTISSPLRMTNWRFFSAIETFASIR